MPPPSGYLSPAALPVAFAFFTAVSVSAIVAPVTVSHFSDLKSTAKSDGISLRFHVIGWYGLRQQKTRNAWKHAGFEIG